MKRLPEAATKLRRRCIYPKSLVNYINSNQKLYENIALQTIQILEMTLRGYVTDLLSMNIEGLSE